MTLNEELKILIFHNHSTFSSCLTLQMFIIACHCFYFLSLLCYKNCNFNIIMHYILMIRNHNEVFIFEHKLQYEFVRPYIYNSVIFIIVFIFCDICGMSMCVYIVVQALDYIYMFRDLYWGIKITNRHSHSWVFIIYKGYWGCKDIKDRRT